MVVRRARVAHDKAPLIDLVPAVPAAARSLWADTPED
jgi:hypothetical protein